MSEIYISYDERGLVYAVEPMEKCCGLGATPALASDRAQVVSTLPQRELPSIIPAMSEASIAKVRKLTDLSLAKLPQYPFVTKHRLHAGQYLRIVTIAASADDAGLVTGVRVKCATNLIIIGEDVTIYMGEGEEPKHVHGWAEFQGSAGRKQAFLSKGAFTMIMSFATAAKTIAEAEAEFTDEIELLWPLADTERHDVVVTGE